MSGQKNIGDCFIDHGKLFCSSNPSIPFDLANLITRVISLTKVSIMDYIPTGEEIFKTIESMGSTKAPDPDGLPALFYTTYLDIVG